MRVLVAGRGTLRVLALTVVVALMLTAVPLAGAAGSTALEAFEAALPDQVTMMVHNPGANAYFDLTVSGGTNLDGVYDGYCIDSEHPIDFGVEYTADVYSSYEPLPAGMVAYPENLDLVNWIVNQGFVGTASPGGYGTYTYGDVQRAIWVLAEDRLTEFGLGEWSEDRTAEIVAAALAAGDGFVPSCGDVLAVIMDPIGFDQITIALIELPCDEEPQTVEIDVRACRIKWWQHRGHIVFVSPRVLRVHLYGSDTFDVDAVDRSTLRLGDPGTGSAVAPVRVRVADRNRDGHPDLVMRFRTRHLIRAGAIDGDTTALGLTGQTDAGTPLIGEDSVRVIVVRL